MVEGGGLRKQCLPRRIIGPGLRNRERPAPPCRRRARALHQVVASHLAGTCLLAPLAVAGAAHGGFGVDHGLGNLREELVGVGLFVQGLLEHAGGVAVAELLGMGAGGAVGRNLVVLDLLGSANEAGIHYIFGLGLVHDLFAFLDQALHAHALLAARLDVELGADALDAADMLFGLLEVGLKGFFELRVGGILGQPGQRLGQLRFGTKQVLELIRQQVVHGFHYALLLYRPYKLTAHILQQSAQTRPVLRIPNRGGSVYVSGYTWRYRYGQDSVLCAALWTVAQTWR